MTTLLEPVQEETVELPYSLRAAVRPFVNKFLADAATHGLKLSPAGFQEWDALFNLDRVRKLFPDDQSLINIGVKTMYMRVFYSCVVTSMKASVAVASQLTPLLTTDEIKNGVFGSSVLAGIDRTHPATLTEEQKTILRDRALENFKRAAKELSRYLTLNKLHKLLDELPDCA